MAVNEADIEAAIGFHDSNNDIELNGGLGSTRLGLGDGAKRKSGTWRSTRTQRRLKSFKTFPARIFSRFTHKEPEESHSSLSPRDEEARDEFFALLLGVDPESLLLEGLFSKECVWFARYLESKVRNSWTSLLTPCLLGLKTNRTEPAADEIAIAYRFLSLTARLLTSRKELALSEIPDALANPPRMLKEQDDDGERPVPNQMAFAALGWLSMLYDPAPNPPNKQVFAIRKPTSLRGDILRTRTFTKYLHDIDQSDTSCLFMLIRNFGTLIMPQVTHGNGEADLITSSYVCYAMLEKVVGVKIEWVNSISLHLEFDNRQRVLKIFRFPSFCLLMCRNKNLTLLSQLYMDHNRHLRKSGLEDPSEDRTAEFFKEVLLSYRLLFGQDRRSWRAFAENVVKWDHNWACSDSSSHDDDPLLRTLCGTSWKSPDARAVYDEIGAPDKEPYYYPDSDFPFFGTRILNLQKFVKGRHPHDARALWYDRSNPAVWWTFWAVLFIGGGTLFLGILQLAFQIWSSVESLKQVNSQGAALPSRI